MTIKKNLGSGRAALFEGKSGTPARALFGAEQFSPAELRELWSWVNAGLRKRAE